MLVKIPLQTFNIIPALITSYDSYTELLGKSTKGLEFYKKLSHNVTALLARLRATAQVQGEERQQLVNAANEKGKCLLFSLFVLSTHKQHIIKLKYV